MGKAALPVLGDAAEHADLETRRRVVIVMERIEDKLNADWMLNPTPIALRFNSEPIKTAMRRTGEQMGFPALVLRCEDLSIDLDTGPMPYWRAWKSVREAGKLREGDWSVTAAGLEEIDDSEARRLRELQFERQIFDRVYSRRGGDPRIELAPKHPTGDPYAEDDGSSVRVRVRWKSLSKQPYAKGTCAVFAVEVRPEPRLEFATLPSVEITKIVDADGKERDTSAVRMFPAPADPKDAPFLAAYSGEIQFDGLLHQKAIPWQGPARPLKELHGRVRLQVLVRPTLLEVPGVLKAQGKEVRGLGGITLKILEADTGEDGRLHIRLRLTNLESLAPQTDEEKIVRVRPGLVAVRGAMDVAMERLRMRDAKGWLHQANTEYKEMDKGIYEASVQFSPRSGNLGEIGLVLTKAAKTLTLDMPFQVRDVPAPAGS